MNVVIQLIMALVVIGVQWLLTLLQKSATNMTPTGDAAADAKNLLTVAVSDPDLGPLKRLFVKTLLWHVPDAIRNHTPLDKGVLEELTDLDQIIPDA